MVLSWKDFDASEEAAMLIDSSELLPRFEAIGEEGGIADQLQVVVFNLPVPKQLHGKTIKENGVRENHKLFVVAAETDGNVFAGSAAADVTLREGTALWVGFQHGTEARDVMRRVQDFLGFVPASMHLRILPLYAFDVSRVWFWIGSSLLENKIRKRHRISVIGISPDKTRSFLDTTLFPSPTHVLEAHDNLLVLKPDFFRCEHVAAEAMHCTYRDPQWLQLQSCVKPMITYCGQNMTPPEPTRSDEHQPNARCSMFRKSEHTPADPSKKSWAKLPHTRKPASTCLEDNRGGTACCRPHNSSISATTSFGINRTSFLDAVLSTEPQAFLSSPFRCLGISKFIESMDCDSNDHQRLVDWIHTALPSACLDKNGCHLVQSLIETTSKYDAKLKIFEALVPNVQELSESKHGNHVLQKLIKIMPADGLNPLLWQLKGSVAKFASHRFGCRILERLLDRGILASELWDELVTSAPTLSRNKRANNVLQHLVKLLPVYRMNLLVRLADELPVLKHDRYGRFVVQCLLEHPSVPHAPI